MSAPASDIDGLLARADQACELCGARDTPLVARPVRGAPGTGLDAHVACCGACTEQLDGDDALDPKRWFGLQDAIWSEHDAVKVVAYRTLRRLSGEGWAQELLEQVYMDDETRTWADAAAASAPAGADLRVVDSNGTPLADGDSVTLIKDLNVKGAGFTAKRGTMVKNIRLGSDPSHIEGRVNKVAIMLKTEFLKKA